MLYRFAHFELDLAAVELRAEGEPVHLEPQVFAVLALLVPAIPFLLLGLMIWAIVRKRPATA